MSGNNDRLWQDRSDIQQIFYRYARGVDRMDFDLIRSCFHGDAIDSRPPLFHGTIDEYFAWVEPQLGAMESSTHVVSNSLIEIDGDRAEAESYYLAVLRTRSDGKLIEAFRGGRYIDSLSYKGGRWAIDVRRAVTDWSRISDITSASAPEMLGAFLANQADDQPPMVSARNRSDTSYRTLHGEI